jgi:hypothetical protein
MAFNATVSDQTVRPDLQSADCAAFGAHHRDQHDQHLDLKPPAFRTVRGRARFFHGRPTVAFHRTDNARRAAEPIMGAFMDRVS